MTTPTAPADATPADTTPAASTPASPAAPSTPAPPSWPWRRAALILAAAAQLITISALVTPDYPLAATWWSLLLGIAPAPLAAAAAFAPAPVGRLAAVLGVVVLVVGGAGGILHISLFFLPALVVLAVAAVKLWREQA
jgi:hypothetical protein